MSENLHDIDKLFRDAIEGQEEPPSGKVWDDIDHQLDKNNIVHTKRKYNNLKLFSAALLLLLVSVIIYQLSAKKDMGVTTAAGNHLPAQDNKAVVTPGKDPVKEKRNAGELKNAAAEQVVPETPATLTDNRKEGIETQQNQDSKTVPEKEAVDRAAAAANETGKNPENPLVPLKANPATGAGKTAGAINKTVVKNNAPAITVVAENKEYTEKTVHADKVKRNNKPVGLIANNTDLSQPVANSNPIAHSFAAGKKGRRRSIENAVKQIPGNNPAAENDEQPALLNNKKQGNEKSTAAAPVPVRAARPLTGVWVEKNNTESAVLPINVSIDNTNAAAGIAMANKAAEPLLTKKRAPLHLSVMPFYSAQFSSTRIEEDHDHSRPFPQGPNDRDKIKNDETYTSSSSVGILLALPLGKKWAIQSGISYNTRNVNIQAKNIYAQLDNDGKVKYRFDCSSGYTYLNPKMGTTPAVGDSISVAASTNKLQYIGVPLNVNYTFFAAKRINVVPAVGIMANFLVKQSIETSLDPVSSNQKENITSIQGLKKTYFNGMAGIAVQYNFSKRIALDIIPAANFALGSINQNATVKSYPNSFSITGGIKIQF